MFKKISNSLGLVEHIRIMGNFLWGTMSDWTEATMQKVLTSPLDLKLFRGS